MRRKSFLYYVGKTELVVGFFVFEGFQFFNYNVSIKNSMIIEATSINAQGKFPEKYS